MGFDKLPSGLKLTDFKDFCIRCEEIYELFWEVFAPFFDITIYRDYLLYGVCFSNNKQRQETISGVAWEYLMGDINRDELIDFMIHLRHGYEK